MCGEYIQELCRGPQTDKHLPQGPFTGQFINKSRHLGLESISYLVPAPILYCRDWRSPTWARAATPLGVEALEKPTFRIGVYELFSPCSYTALQRLAQSYLGRGSYTPKSGGFRKADI